MAYSYGYFEQWRVSPQQWLSQNVYSPSPPLTVDTKCSIHTTAVLTEKCLWTVIYYISIQKFAKNVVCILCLQMVYLSLFVLLFYSSIGLPNIFITQLMNYCTLEQNIHTISWTFAKIPAFLWLLSLRYLPIKNLQHNPQICMTHVHVYWFPGNCLFCHYIYNLGLCIHLSNLGEVEYHYTSFAI